MKKNTIKGLFLAFALLLSLGVGVRAEAAAKNTLTVTAKTARAGFHPGKGNALLLYTAIRIPEKTADVSYRCRLHILNAQGKYVFERIFDVPAGSAETFLLSYQWDGKAGKKNEAKLTAGSYIPDGKYKAEFYLYAKGSTEEARKTAAGIPAVTRRASFTVSGSARTGAAILKAVQGPVLRYTGYSDVDYIAEQMVKAAGVTVKMSDEEKVKKLYHYMTLNFKHIKAGYDTSSYKVYYNLNRLRSKINEYDTAVYKKWIKGGIVFDNKLAGWLSMYNLQRRIGVCTENATVFKILLAHVGVQSGLCEGYYLNRNGTKSGHTWNWVVVDGKKYFYDVDVEIINHGKGQGDYYWYKESLSASKRRHQYISSEKVVNLKVPTWQGW